MPYIKPADRSNYVQITSRLETTEIKTVGDLNFLITKTIHTYLKQHGVKYATMNDIVGALESAKAEFQRRIVAPYENSKIAENGDVI